MHTRSGISGVVLSTSSGFSPEVVWVIWIGGEMERIASCVCGYHGAGRAGGCFSFV